MLNWCKHILKQEKTNVKWEKQMLIDENKKEDKEKKKMSAHVKPLSLWPESVDQKQQI